MTKKRLNWVDYTLIVVVLLALAFLGYQYVTVKNATASLTNDREVYMTVIFSAQPDYVVNNIKENETVRYNVKEKDLGEIVSVKTYPAQSVNTNALDGTYVMDTLPERYDAEVVVRTTGKETDNAIFAGHLQVATGQAISLRNKDFAAAGYILSVEVREQE